MNIQTERYTLNDLDGTITMIEQERETLRRLFRDFETPPNPANHKDRKRIVTDICLGMRRQIESEREELYPAAQDCISDPQTLNRSLVETVILEYLTSVIESLDPAHPLYEAYVDVLGELTLRHFRDQEEELLNEIMARGGNGHYASTVTNTQDASNRLLNA